MTISASLPRTEGFCRVENREDPGKLGCTVVNVKCMPQSVSARTCGGETGRSTRSPSLTRDDTVLEIQFLLELLRSPGL